MSWKKDFSRFLGAAPGRLHFAAHSHHPWPDATFAAHEQAWLDAARLADLKWDAIFTDVLPRAQAYVARLLSLPDPATVCFAPSTHELVMRLLSTLPPAVRVLTTDGEFHSFERQMRRLEEAGRARVERVPVEPFETFGERFAQTASAGAHDLVYLSQCFFNTGFHLAAVAPIVAAVPRATPVVVDGYHAFMARPVDLSMLADRAFYVGGGYKYAMAGEGACFMHCPPGYGERPVDTGWFASFGTLTAPQSRTQVPYTAGGARFLGATFDPTALYRFNAVQHWLEREQLTVATIRTHVETLQAQFLALREADGLLAEAALTPPRGTDRGNFLVFRHRNARAWHAALLAQDVLTDCRDDRLRIGFGIYQDGEDVAALARRLQRLAKHN